jgi:hypothetical protein
MLIKNQKGFQESFNALHATATVLCGCMAAWKHSTVVAVAHALSVAVRERGR